MDWRTPATGKNADLDGPGIWNHTATQVFWMEEENYVFQFIEFNDRMVH